MRNNRREGEDEAMNAKSKDTTPYEYRQFQRRMLAVFKNYLSAFVPN